MHGHGGGWGQEIWAGGERLNLKRLSKGGWRGEEEGGYNGQAESIFACESVRVGLQHWQASINKQHSSRQREKGVPFEWNGKQAVPSGCELDYEFDQVWSGCVSLG